MLDYELMVQHIVTIDTTDNDNILFTVSPDGLLRSNLECQLTRRVNGWGVRVELWIDDLVYHSATVRGTSGDDTLHPDEAQLVALHDNLMNEYRTRHQITRDATLKKIDAMNEIMANADH